MEKQYNGNDGQKDEQRNSTVGTEVEPILLTIGSFQGRVRYKEDETFLFAPPPTPCYSAELPERSASAPSIMRISGNQSNLSTMTTFQLLSNVKQRLSQLSREQNDLLSGVKEKFNINL